MGDAFLVRVAGLAEAIPDFTHPPGLLILASCDSPLKPSITRK
jgi:hypothetical protein